MDPKNADRLGKSLWAVVIAAVGTAGKYLGPKMVEAVKKLFNKDSE